MSVEAGSVHVRLTADDEASGKIKKVSGELNTLETKGLKPTTKSAAELKGGLDSVGEAAEKSGKKIKDTADKSKESGEKIQSVGETWQKTGRSIRDFGEGIDTVTKPLQMAAVATAGAGVAAAKAAMTYESSFARVKKTVDGTPEEMEAINRGIKEMSETTPVSAAEIANLTAVGGQLGIEVGNNGETLLKFTKTMADMGVATNLVGEEGAASMAKFMNVMNMNKNEVGNLGSTVVDLGNHSATTERDIMYMAERMGKFGNTVHMSAPQVLGYSAALSSLGIEAQMGGSAIGRVWLDIQEAVSDGGDGLKKYAKYAGTSAKEFAKQWSTDPSGAFNGLIKGLSTTKDLTKALGELGVDNIQDKQAVMALANNYDLMAESVERANIAYSENTALSKEANAAYATTANQLELTKNKIVNAGISLGEIILPEIQSGAEWVGNLANKFSELDETQQKGLITAGKWVIGIGAGAKVTASAVKGVGGFVEGMGKIAAAVPAITKIGPAIAAIPKSALIAGAVIGTITLAGKKAYDEIYDSQYRWTEGLAKGNREISESLNKYKSIRDIQKEVSGLKLIIDNPDSSAAQVESAKARLDEIREMLSQEYNLVINSDNSNLEKTVEDLAQLLRNELQINMANQQGKLNTLVPEVKQFREEGAALEQQMIAANEAHSALELLNSDFETLGTSLRNDLITQEEYTNGILEIKKALGYTDEQIANSEVMDVEIDLSNRLDEASDKATKLTKQFNDLKGSYEEYRAISTEMSNWGIELIGDAAERGDNAAVEDYLKRTGELIRNAQLDMTGYAQAAANAMNGITMQDAISKGGESLTNYVNDYIRSMQSFGAVAEDTAVGAALIKNGFQSIEQAAKTEGGLAVVSQQATELERSLGGIPDNVSLSVNADGNITIVSEAQNALNELRAQNNMQLNVDAEGNISLLNTATNEVNMLNGQNVHVQVTADGDIQILNEANRVIAEIPAECSQDVTVNTAAETEGAKGEISDLSNTPVQVNVTADTGAAQSAINNLNKSVTVTINYLEIGKPKKNAKGTRSFSGGLAMVNDEVGISDPRELIIDKNTAFIPQGRNVILPLSKGARVYTASQTKAIMSGLGIPQYAGGKDNDLSKLNKRSRTYIDTRMALNDWEAYADTAEAALSRIRERNEKELKNMTIDEYEFSDTMDEMGEALYDGRINQSEKWLAHEAGYNNMALSDYAAGIERMKIYTNEYYSKGIINHRKYIESMTELDEKYIDKSRELYKERYEVSKGWISDRTYFNDWGDFGDDPVSAYRRVEEYINASELSAKEKAESIKALGSEMFRERKEQSLSWLDEQRKYFNMSDNEYYAGIKRIQAYTEEYLSLGIITRREYNEVMTELTHKEADEISSMYDKLLAQNGEYISALRTKLSDEERALQDRWTIADRGDSLDDVNEQLAIYKNAVTQRGKEKYESLLAEKKRLEREGELYELQQKNNSVIEKLQTSYDYMENNKAVILQSLRTGTFDMEETQRRIALSVNTANSNLNLAAANSNNLLLNIYNALQNIPRALAGSANSYSDNRTYNIASSDSSDNIYKYINGTWVGGMGAVVFNGKRN